MIRATWEQRIERARELAEVYAASAEVLRFYANLAERQRELHRLVMKAGSDSPLRSASSFREAFDFNFLAFHFSSFLAFAREIGPPAVSQAADQLLGQPSHWGSLLADSWSRIDSQLSAAESFLIQGFLQPAAEFVAARIRIPPGISPRATCPVCDAEPVVGVLRPEGLGARRSLVCSFCATEWEYLRGVCPACGEDRSEALCVYTAEQFEHVRVEACDTCKAYIKTVDLAKNGLAIAVVDELATLPLTLWAEQNGYTKLEPNLLAV